jgi:DNA-3-methyladenine glycosylase
MSAKSFSLLSNPVVVARSLLGCQLLRICNNHKLVVTIVETEAYDQQDAASHSYHGRTARNDVMFGPPGYAYIYFTYGMHYCMNIVTGPEGYGSAVLIRAVEPVEGIRYIQQNRKNIMNKRQLTNGPAKLCQALEIDNRLNGHDLSKTPLRVKIYPAIDQTKIISSTRIGITKNQDTLWRFYIKDNPYVSKLN